MLHSPPITNLQNKDTSSHQHLANCYRRRFASLRRPRSCHCHSCFVVALLGVVLAAAAAAAAIFIVVVAYLLDVLAQTLFSRSLWRTNLDASCLTLTRQR